MTFTNNLFKKQIADPKNSIIKDLNLDSSTLLIAFGGINGALGIPPFEFFKITSELKVNKIYLRHLNQSW